MTANAPGKSQATLGDLTSRGFLLLSSRSAIGRILSPLSQLVLARLLLPEDYGLIGLAYTVTSLATIVQATGVREVLIRRHRHMRRWRDTGFWFATVLGLASGLMVLAAAPLAASFYEEPALVALLGLMALISPLSSLLVVPQASLSSQMRFRRILAGDAIDLFGWPTLTIVFAFLGFGAYSFVIPRLAILVAQVLIYWRLSQLPLPRLQFRPRRWRLLWRDVSMLLGSGFLLTVAAHLDRVMLGRIADAATVGVYYFGFSLAFQPLALFSASIVNVLLPAFSRLQHSAEQQRAAFLRANGVVSCVLMPLCLLVGALAEPIILHLFGARWAPAIPFMQVLSFGAAFDAATAPSHAFVRAQGRFRIILIHAMVMLLFYLGLGWILAQRYGPMGVALAFVLNNVLCGVLLTALALGAQRESFRLAVCHYFAPLAMFGPPLALLYSITYWVPEPGAVRTVVLGCAAAAACVAYGLTLILARPDVVGEIRARFGKRRSVNSGKLETPA